MKRSSISLIYMVGTVITASVFASKDAFVLCLFGLFAAWYIGDVIKETRGE